MKLSKLLMNSMVVVALSGISGLALAQEAKPAAKPAAPAAQGAPQALPSDDNVSYKAKTVYDFEDDMVEGDLQRPDGELIEANKRAKHSSLIEIRKDFIPEMLKSLEDV
jgi:hypothetical protein